MPRPFGEPTELAAMPPGPDERWPTVKRIADSPVFHRSNRLRELLLYIAERSLTGDDDQLTECEIGRHLFGRGEPLPACRRQSCDPPCVSCGSSSASTLTFIPTSIGASRFQKGVTSRTSSHAEHHNQKIPSGPGLRLVRVPCSPRRPTLPSETGRLSSLLRCAFFPWLSTRASTWSVNTPCARRESQTTNSDSPRL
jgi:hypothetical protein